MCNYFIKKKKIFFFLNTSSSNRSLLFYLNIIINSFISSFIPKSISTFINIKGEYVRSIDERSLCCRSI